MDKLQQKNPAHHAQAATGELTGVDVSNENKQVEFIILVILHGEGKK